MDDKLCLYPFSHVFVTQLKTDSEYRLNCCSVNNLDEMHSNGSILENYNSEYFRNLRAEHIAGRGLEHPHCRVCRESEERTGNSPRIANNRHLSKQLGKDFDKLIEKIRVQDLRLMLDDITSMEYMPSNYCNYACIMCSAFASSQRALMEKLLGYNDLYEFTDQVPDGLDDIIANVKLLGFAGGETLLQPRVIEIINDLIEQGQIDKKISILTNLSKYDSETYRKLEKFQECFVTFSIDGIGKVGEYQRQRSSWKTVSENLQMIRENHPRIEYVVNYVVTAISAVGIPDFLRWAYHNDIQDVIFSPVKNREFMSIDALPQHVIDRLLAEMESLKTLSHKDDLRDFPATVESAISLYQSYKFDAGYSSRFRYEMEREDRLRKDGLTLHTVVPDWNSKDD